MPRDVEAFLQTLTEWTGQRAWFERGCALSVARAPGRLDLMGGIADYSGALVLQWPLQQATLAACQRDSSSALRILTLSGPASFEMSLADFDGGGGPIAYEAARAFFHRDPAQRWAAYVAGVFLVLMRERGARFADGARILIASEVPQCKGVSSSAALEVAAMQAVAGAYGIALPPRELALLCQKVENLVAGAPCGVMDQMTAVFGQEGRLLALLCQPAEIEGFVPIPEDIGVWGLDSGVRHCISGADYSSVRVGAFMGRRILSELGGRPLECLVHLTPSEFEQSQAARLPERMLGAEFLARYGETGDPVTRVSPDRAYAVRAPTAHPIYEHFRVRAFAQLLGGAPGESRLELLGELMYQSHASYSACGLGCEGTDLLVRLVRQAGPEKGLYGAKITGGGSGGTVAVLGRRGADAAVEAIAEEYARQTGYRPILFRGSSSGAADFGCLQVEV